MQAATATRSDQVSSPAEHSWQTLVLLAGSQSDPAMRRNAPAYVRFDSPHSKTPDPWLLAQWSEDFGWHRCLQQSSTSSAPALSHAPRASDPAVKLNGMLAEVAHDIRSPIAVAQQIISSVVQQAAAAGQWSAEHKELLHEAQLRLAQANRWAEGILVQHSLDHGQPVSIRRRFYPQQWLRSIQPLLNSLAKQRGVRLLWIGWDRSLPRLYSDANQLSRTLLNLVENAIQASRPGGEVRVTVAWQTRVTQRMIVTIEDDGRGLSREQTQQINAPLSLSNNSSQTICSMGLGLATAKTLVGALGGTLRVQLPSGGGTQFNLILPVDNYHSLVHSWLQQPATEPHQNSSGSQQRIAIHAIRSAASVTAPAMCNEIDLQLQQAASSDDLVYRVARDRWLWLSKQAATSSGALPSGMSAALHKLRERDNAWNVPLECRRQQVFAWQPAVSPAVSDSKSPSESKGQTCMVRLTSIIAERIAELIGDHIPPIDDLQATETPMVVRPNAGGPARLIRSDNAHWDERSAVASAAGTSNSRNSNSSAPAIDASLAETPCEKFSGTLAELAQQWHSRQVRLDQIQKSVKPPRI